MCCKYFIEGGDFKLVFVGVQIIYISKCIIIIKHFLPTKSEQMKREFYNEPLNNVVIFCAKENGAFPKLGTNLRYIEDEKKNHSLLGLFSIL